MLLTKFAVETTAFTLHETFVLRTLRARPKGEAVGLQIKCVSSGEEGGGTFDYTDIQMYHLQELFPLVAIKDGEVLVNSDQVLSIRQGVAKLTLVPARALQAVPA